MPHQDWILNAQQAESRDYREQDAHKQLRDGYIFVILDALYRLDLDTARRLFEAGKDFLAAEERWADRRTAAAIKPLLDTVAKAVADGDLSLEKPLPYISSQAALVELQKITGSSYGTVHSYHDDQCWTVEQIIRTSRGLFEIELNLEPRGGFDPPTWYLETYLYRFRVIVRDWQLHPVVEEKHITFGPCLQVVKEFLEKNPPVEEGPKAPQATSAGR